jgi:hypothetical protein
MGRFQPSHKQGKHNAYHRDEAHQPTVFELTGSGLHGRLRRSNREIQDFSLQQFPQLCQRSLWY